MTTDVSQLSNAELDTKLSAAMSGKPSDPPAAAAATDPPAKPDAPAKGTPAQAGKESPAPPERKADEPAPGAAVGDEPAKPAAGAAGAKAADEPAPGAKQEPLYAERFKTTAELSKEVDNLLTKLKAPVYAVDGMKALVAAATESGDWKTVEAGYKTLQQEYSRSVQKAAEPGKPGADATAGADPQGAVAPEEIAKVDKFVMTELAETMSKHPLRNLFEQKGVAWPKSQADLDALEEDYPTRWIRYGQALSQAKQDILGDVQLYYDSLNGVEQANTKAKDDGRAAVKAISDQFKLGLTPEKIDAVLERALADAGSYEERHGVDYLRPDAVRNYFLTRELEAIIPEALSAAEAAGRTQHAEDLKKMRERTVDSASTAASPGAGRPGSPQLDMTDKTVVRNLTQKQLDEAYTKALARR